MSQLAQRPLLILGLKFEFIHWQECFVGVFHSQMDPSVPYHPVDQFDS